MAVNIRNNNIPAIWAANAQTTIPNPPVVGIGYRNTALTNSLIQAGQLYKSLGDSAAWNQYLYNVSAVAQAAEVYGIMPYSGLTTYKDRSLCLYTDRLIYRAKMDVPTGTPCTNATYWEQYIPDGVQIAPPVTATAGVTLYVDYAQSTSGDGLTAATAFKNFNECFSAIRTKFAAANGMFTGSSWIPLFTIIATGNANNTIEAGDWRFQQMGLEIKFNRNFTMGANNGGIYLQGCIVRLSGTGSLTVNDAVSVVSSDLSIACTLNTNNTSSTHEAGAGFSLRNGNLTIETGASVNFLGVGSGFLSSGGFVNVFGTMTAKTKNTAANGAATVMLVSSDLYVQGTCEFDVSSTSASPALSSQFQQSVVRVNGAFSCRYIELISSSVSVSGIGILATGSRYSRPAFGIVLRGSYVYMLTGASLSQLGAYDPATKGAATVGGFVEGGPVTQNQWPGAAAWILFGNGAYYTS